MADIPNTLQLAVELDTSDAKKKSDELSKKLSEMLKALDKSSKTQTSFSESIKDFDDLARTITNLTKRIDSLRNKQDVNAANTAQYKRTQKEVDRLTISLEGLKKIQDELVNKPLAAKQAATTARIAEAAAGTAIIKGELSQRPILKSDEEKLQRASQTSLVKTQEPILKSDEELNQGFTKTLTKTDAIKIAIDKINSVLKIFKRETDKIGESTKKTDSKWKILLERIKRISIYRAIRRAIQIVMQTITQGFQRIVDLSDDAAELSARLKTDYNLIAASIGSVVYTLLNSFGGGIDNLTDKLLNFFNSLNHALATLLGASSYIKVVRKETEALGKSAKFTFDKFEALQQPDENLLGIDIETIKLSTDELSKLTDEEKDMYNWLVAIRNAINAVMPILKQLWQIGQDIWNKVLQPIINSGFVSGVINFVGSIIQALDSCGALELALYALLAAIVAVKLGFGGLGAAVAAGLAAVIYLVVSYWDDIIYSIKMIATDFVNAIIWVVEGVVNVIIAALNVIVDFVNLLLKPIDLIAQLFGGKANTIQVTKFNYISIPRVDFKANGGFTTANFIATNENGKREWVGRNAGATAVVNDTQMSDIMYQAVKQGSYEGIIQAMYETDFGGSSTSSTELVVDNYTLGKIVASSAGFRDEINRRNVSLNLR